VIDLRRLDDETYTAGIRAKGVEDGALERLAEAARRRRELSAEVSEMRARRKAASRQIAEAPPEERPARIEAATALKEDLAGLEGRLEEAEREVEVLGSGIPNAADPSVPPGGEADAEVVRVVGEPSGSPAMDHADFGERIGFVDSSRAARVSGPRFAYLAREAVLLEVSMVRWALDRLGAEGFVPVVPPVLVKEQTMFAAGFFPTDRQQVYRAVSAAVEPEPVDGRSDELFLVGTSEVPLAGLHIDEILSEDDLPLRYAGFSSCFRREAGTYGRDTRGIFRVHQFDKVEMFSFAHPDRSWEEHERLLSIEESLVRELELPYRVVNIAAGDLGAAAAKKYDIEVWLPSEGRYRELTSCSNYTDFSARRLGTRFRSGGETRLVHTLNGTACAVGRTLVFLLEHYQDGGAFVVPDALRPYCGMERVQRSGEASD
jgi:seryl-tRNA synthetase